MIDRSARSDGLLAASFLMLLGTTCIPSTSFADEIRRMAAVAPILANRFEAPPGAIDFGSSVSAGDIDGDGIPDLVMGGNPTHVYSGATYEPLLTIPGSGHRFGVEVDVVGDVNGDQHADILIAITDFTNHVQVYSGANGTLIPELYSRYVDSSDLGVSMVAMGDANLDGFGDFVIGWHEQTGPAKTDFYSGAGGRLIPTIGAGYSVAAMGDVNDDGFPDFATGRYGPIRVTSGIDGDSLYSVPGFDANLGAADISGDGVRDLLLAMPHISGMTTYATVVAFSGVDGDTLGRVSIALPDCAQGCFFRSFVAGIGDVDGDGHEEFAASAVGTGPWGQGRVCLFSGRTLERLIDLQGSTANRGFGWSLVGPGDVDGDDIPDLLVGESGPGGVNGGPSGGAVLYRLAHGVTGVEEPLAIGVDVRPNPVHRGQPVTFAFPSRGAGTRLEADVYDTRGRLVRTIHADKGSRFTWDGRDGMGHLVSLGVYVVRSRGGHPTRKIVVVP